MLVVEILAFIDLNGMSTHLELFYASCILMFTFFMLVFQKILNIDNIWKDQFDPFMGPDNERVLWN